MIDNLKIRHPLFSTLQYLIKICILSLLTSFSFSMDDKTDIVHQDQPPVYFNRSDFTHTITDDEYTLICNKEFTLAGIGLFAGNDWVSSCIRNMTNSQISHCSLILSDKEGIWYNLESTGSYEEIMERGMLPQVQIHLWDDILKTYHGDVFYRLFKFNSPENNMSDMLAKILKENLGKSYETNPFTLIKAIKEDNTTEDLSTLFCSELDAMVLKQLGYLDNSQLCDNYLPRDFTCEPAASLKLIGCSLEDQTQVRSLINLDNTQEKKDHSNDNKNGDDTGKTSLCGGKNCSVL